MAEPMRVGIVGCGDVASRLYVPNRDQFEQFSFVACADVDSGRATQLARDGSLEVLSIDELLASEVDSILNLTPPAAHEAVSIRAIEHGKHVYSEKPLALRSDGARRLLECAREHGVRIACSPDTFLGPALTEARHLVSAGALGLPVSA